MLTLLESVDNRKYLVTLGLDDQRLYAAMRNAETEWLTKLERAGATLFRHTRRVVVLVPPTCVIPDSLPLQATVTKWKNRVKKLAEQEKKAKTIGDRSGRMPEWLDSENGKAIRRDVSNRPGYNAERITWHTQTAYRGGMCTPDEVKNYFRNGIEAGERFLANSQAKNDEKRAKRQQYELDTLKALGEKIEEIFDTRDVMGGRLISGEAFKLHVKCAMLNFSSSVTNVALIPVNEGIKMVPAPMRERVRRGVEILKIGKMELHLTAIDS